MSEADANALYFAGFLNGLSTSATLEFDEADRELLRAAAICLLTLSGLDSDELIAAYECLDELRELEKADGVEH